MRRSKLPANSAKRYSVRIHVAHLAGVRIIVLSCAWFWPGCMKARNDGMRSILAICHPLKILDAVVCFATIFMIDLWKALWVVDKSERDKPVNKVNPLTKVDSLVSLWGFLGQRVLPCRFLPRHRLSVKCGAVRPAESSDISQRANLVFWRKTRDCSPFFFIHSTDTVKEHMQNIIFNYYVPSSKPPLVAALEGEEAVA